MKLTASYIVLAAVVTAAAPVRALPVVATTTSAIGDAFFRLINIQTRIKAVEKINYEVLSPALNDISRKLHQGWNTVILRINTEIRNAFADVKHKVGEISGNFTSSLLQISYVTHTTNTLQLSDATLDYNVKANLVKKVYGDTLATANILFGLFNETKEILGRSMSSRLRRLELMIRLASADNIPRHQSNSSGIPDRGINDESVKKAVAEILDHIKWLEGEGQDILVELDKERSVIAVIAGNIERNSGSVAIITDEFDSVTAATDDYLREASKDLAKLMNNLRDEVFNVTSARGRRAAE